MKRSLYPESTVNRVTFWFGVVWVSLCIWKVNSGDFVFAAVCACFTVFDFIFVYVFPSKPVQGASDEYTAVISRIKGIEDELSKLSGFLNQERKRVTDTESILSKLKDERTKLEPIVSANRETVDAILAAHSARQRSNAWRERFIGFSFGILASLIASILYSYFKQWKSSRSGSQSTWATRLKWGELSEITRRDGIFLYRKKQSAFPVLYRLYKPESNDATESCKMMILYKLKRLTLFLNQCVIQKRAVFLYRFIQTA